MKIVYAAVFTGLVLAAGATYAGKATEPAAMARQDLMDTIGMNVKVLGDMAGGKAAFDATAATAAKAAIEAAAAEIAVKFEPQTTDPESKAKPEIWANWDDFIAKANGLGAAATAMDTATVEGVQAGMGAIGGSCKACHSDYRM
jgi:cytochrome c556